MKIREKIKEVKKEKSITKKFIKWNIQDKNKECNPNKKKEGKTSTIKEKYDRKRREEWKKVGWGPNWFVFPIAVYYHWNKREQTEKNKNEIPFGHDSLKVLLRIFNSVKIKNE